ncbi:inositol 1,4,5-trisphosphate receptor type 1 [Sesbania bispinosa]|nr:inositol 1,4,5-trisphosphate receptor type 1 [Sesbania bispinosa]
MFSLKVLRSRIAGLRPPAVPPFVAGVQMSLYSSLLSSPFTSVILSIHRFLSSCFRFVHCSVLLPARPLPRAHCVILISPSCSCRHGDVDPSLAPLLVESDSEVPLTGSSVILYWHVLKIRPEALLLPLLRFSLHKDPDNSSRFFLCVTINQVLIIFGVGLSFNPSGSL